MRADGACVFDRLLNDGPPRLAARSSFDDTGDVGSGAVAAAINQYRCLADMQNELTRAGSRDTNMIC